MNVLSLFAGIGGLELGLERAGMTTVGQVEIDDYCRRVLAKHWPDVPRHTDVRSAADWWLAEERPTVDVICGGFPCQDISSAGRRAGIIDGERSSLWTYFAHTIRVLRPRYVVVENVSALLVRGLDVVAADLAACGYDLQWDCVPAASVGAPHRRDRWFGIAYPAGVVGADEPNGGDEDRLAVGAIARASGRTDGGRDAAGDHEPGRSACIVAPVLADTDGPSRPSAGGSGKAVFQPGAVKRPGRRSSSERGHWAVEPGMGRVAHGVPARVDRLRVLGNAVVPQVAEHIGRLVVAHAEERAA